VNIASLLRRVALMLPEAPAVAQGTNRALSYEAVARRVAQVAGALSSRGFPKGSHIALVMQNSPAYVEALLAIWHGGRVAVPINAKLHAREIAHILSDSKALAVIVTPDLETTIQAAVSGISSVREIFVTGTKSWQQMFQHDQQDLASCAPQDLAWLFYTSGTTGNPKGAMLTHENLMAMALGYLAEVDPVAATDCLLHAAPMSHGSGLYLVPHLLAGAKQVIPESGKFDPEEIASILPYHEGISFFAAPTMVKRLIAAPSIQSRDLHHLKTIVYGGGPMYGNDLKAALKLLGNNRLVQIYGQGESPMTISVLGKAQHGLISHPNWERRLASVGIPQAIVEVRVADKNDRSLPVTEQGEILVRGATVMKGYWQNPAATAETLRGGWLHTGDLGSFDEAGFLTLHDRSKDLVISGGSNIYPREVEEVLLCYPGVNEAAVIGVPDAEWGEVLVAFIVAARTITSQELDQYCLNHIARFKRPKRYEFVAALPKNNYGKVVKNDLRSLLNNSTRVE